MTMVIMAFGVAESLPVLGAWIEILLQCLVLGNIQSLPVRGAWIEISVSFRPLPEPLAVAPRAGSVD